ncbi:hypothetical protein SLEP1_g57901 [Rubroshorea leprosula]|nr:hypothetical protein SLEP1_g57901 [Rubroshorea leprosula]
MFFLLPSSFNTPVGNLVLPSGKNRMVYHFCYLSAGSVKHFSIS